MKRRIHQNVWGNWNAYEGRRKVLEFGLDARDAREWLASGVDPRVADRAEIGRLVLRKFNFDKEAR